MTKREFLYLRRKKFKVLTGNFNKVFKFKKQCPICGSNISVTANSFYLDRWGWVADEIEIQCETHPGFESEDFDDWMNGHYSMPYTDWLPLEIKLLRWFEKKVRFIKNYQKRTAPQLNNQPHTP